MNLYDQGIALPDLLPPARLFLLVRDVDHSGVSGTGVVADGVQWPNGAVSLHWRGPFGSCAYWDSDLGITGVRSVHGHDGATRVVWA